MSANTLCDILQRLADTARQFIARRSLARLLSTFLCCVIIVIRPFSRIGGQYAFLVLALKELVFSVQDNLAQQLELTCLNILGALVGIGLSTLARYAASLTPSDSAGSRAICAGFLVLICFLAGLVKSRLVRLQLSMRISCFISVWLLTNDTGIPERVLRDSANFLWVTISSAVICLVSLLVMMVVFRGGASSSFESETASALAALQDCLSASIHRVHPSGVRKEHSYYQATHAALLSKSVKLNETYSQAAFELRMGRLSLQSIHPFIGVIEHLRRELVWGLAPTKPAKSMPSSPRSQPSTPIHSVPASPRIHASQFVAISDRLYRTKFLSAIEPPALALAEAIIHAMSTVERLILISFHQRSSLRPTRANGADPDCQWVNVQDAEEKLKAARDETRELLRHIFDEIDMEQRAAGINAHVPAMVLDCSLAVITLLQMAHEMSVALQTARRIAALYDGSSPRLWFPHLSLAWLGVPPRALIADDTGGKSVSSDHLPLYADDDHEEVWADEQLTMMEARQGLAERAYSFTLIKGRPLPAGGIASRYDALAAASRDALRDARVCSWRFLTLGLSALWTNERMLRARIVLSRWHRSLQHSSHWRHGLKNAVGVAILSLPGFLPEDTAGRRWFGEWHGQWMVISYLWVLETNSGATWRTGYLRLFGTLMGAIYAYIAAIICKTNPYALVVMVTAFDIPITWIILQTSVTPLAVPASVALPPIVFSQYINPDPSVSALKQATVRFVMISVGIVGALLMNSLVFPRHCRVLFLQDTSRTLGLLSSLYLTLSHDMFRVRRTRIPDERRKILKLELRVRAALSRLSTLLNTMNDELSLLPKPLRHYREVVATTQKLLDLMTGLRKIRENIPRKETVAKVFKERREFMSCVCIILYACQHAFRAREPLPQFLPSARHAFANLEAHVQDCIHRAREEDPHALGLSLVYAFAEQQVMKNMVDTLEELLELTGRLFGTSAWLTHETRFSRASTIEEGDQHGWYSTFRWED